MTADTLSSLADAVAAAVGGAVSIMDPDGFVIAYSSVQDQPIDTVRREGILGKRVPKELLVHHREVAFRAERTVRLVYAAGALPRLAIAVGTGGDHLGSIWSIAPAASDSIESEAAAVLTRAAESALPLLLARREPACVGNDRLAALLTEENAAVSDVMRVVVAAEIAGKQPPSVLEQLAVRLELLLPRTPESGTVVIDGTVYSIHPAPTPEGFEDEVEAARQRVSASLDVTVSIGISDPSVRARTAREQAHRVLEVLAGQPCSATYRGKQKHIMLSDIGNALQCVALPVSGVDAMLAHDDAEGTSYAATVLALLEHESNVSLAASSMYLHSNTFRYRLRRTTELFGLDLDDPDTRLLTWLTLRLRRQ
ncbi:MULTISPECIES: PucR family transcriptional regulator [Nocardiaceae]|uniref:PucR family transcriptional regulator n=1 Tax=Nocardiaceae TaxID=85025 RepID=UPI0011404F07|nr:MULTISPECIES: helix-turn-helix domain-containing protein [Rhodococcus]